MGSLADPLGGFQALSTALPQVSACPFLQLLFVEENE